MNDIIQGDVLEELKKLPAESINCIVTSPPYWGLRDYGIDGQFGLEPTLDAYLEHMLMVTAELMRVLRNDGVMFWNHGDCYGGIGHSDWVSKDPSHKGWSKNGKFQQNPDFKIKKLGLQDKCMALQHHRLIIRMIDDQGWILRNVIIWHKPNHMPSSVKDRFSNSYEPVFMLTKSKRYWFDLDAVREPHQTPLHSSGRKETEQYGEDSGNRKRTLGIGDDRKWGTPLGKNPGDVWEAFQGNPPRFRIDKERWTHPSGANPGDLWKIPTQPFPEAHFATFPERLVEPMIKAGCPKDVCKKCGKPRVRIVEQSGFRPTGHGDTPSSKLKLIGKELKLSKSSSLLTRQYKNIYNKGWTDCGCNAGFTPGIVLDPFTGSGTTLIVARKLLRSYLGIELNPKYVEMANNRLSKIPRRLDVYV